eukprot:13526736-Ditylum_brightwellii.AAC.1
MYTAQEQMIAIHTMYHKIYTQQCSPLYQVYPKHNESVKHITCGCPKISKKKYVSQHDEIAKYFHWLLLKDHDLIVLDQWHLHKLPKNKDKVMNLNENTKLMWDTTNRVDHPVEANGPVFVFLGKKSAFLVEVSVPADVNMITNCGGDIQI